MVQKKVFDELTLLFDYEDTSAWTVSTHNSSIVDLATYGGYDYFNPARMQLRWPGLNSGGAATVNFQLISDDSATPTTVIWIGPVLTLAAAKAKFMDQDWVMHLPMSDVGRYFRLNIVIGTAALTGGRLTAGLVK